MIPALVGVLLLVPSLAGSSFQSHDGRSGRASIEGLVVRAGSGEPLPRAQVTLIRIDDSATDPASSATTPPAVTSGADGRFVVRHVAPGSYRIAVARNGYARQEYGQRVFGGQGTVMTIVPGQIVRGITFHLTPTGTVTGVVHDSSGEPIVGAQVQLLRSSYNASGLRTLRVAGGDRTNDRGEYRLYWITPGRYYVAVAGAAPGRVTAAANASGSGNEIVENRYPTSYYPGTTDLDQASWLDVAPGAEIASVDVVVPEQDLFRVSGRIIDPIAGHHPHAASVSLTPRTTLMPVVASGHTQSYNPSDGTFVLREVAPGAYWIRAIVAAGSADVILTPDAAGRTVADVFVDSLFAGRQVAQAPLDLSGDAEGLVLALGSGVALRGVVSVDDQPLSAVAGFERLEVTLSAAVSGMLTNPSRHEPLGPDGAFTLPNVLPGEYTVAVTGLPRGYYVKQARVGKVDALERPLLVTGPSAGTLSIVLGRNAGQIEGVAVNDRGQPSPGVEVVLVPARRRARLDLYRTAIADKSGGFVIRDVAPGDYQLFAWEAIESFGYFDESLLRQSAQQGATVRIEESSRARVEVTVIPARFQ